MKHEQSRTIPFAPTPCVLLCAGDFEKANIITLAWAGVVNSTPLMIGVSMRKETHSYGLIVEHGEFTVNVPHAGMIRETDICGVISGADNDKFRVTGLTKIPSKKVKTAIIEEAIINLECVVRQTIELGSHTLFIGEVVQSHIDDRISNEEDKVSLETFRPIAYCPVSREYRAVGEALGRFGFTRRST